MTPFSGPEKYKHQQFPKWSWRSFRRNWWRTSGEVWKEIFELLLLGKIVKSIFHQNSTAIFTLWRLVYGERSSLISILVVVQASSLLPPHHHPSSCKVAWGATFESLCCRGAPRGTCDSHWVVCDNARLSSNTQARTQMGLGAKNCSYTSLHGVPPTLRPDRHAKGSAGLLER